MMEKEVKEILNGHAQTIHYYLKQKGYDIPLSEVRFGLGLCFVGGNDK